MDIEPIVDIAETRPHLSGVPPPDHSKMAHRHKTSKPSLVATMLLLPLLLTLCTMMNTDSETHTNIRITAWNSRGFYVAQPYLLHLLVDTDIMAISEHKLYNHELEKLNTLNSDFCAFGKSSDDLELAKYGRVPGHCGVAILWRKTLMTYIRPLKNLGTDRQCVIQVQLPGSACLYVIAVYMPQATSQIAKMET